jgi:hypothetical protein
MCVRSGRSPGVWSVGRNSIASPPSEKGGIRYAIPPYELRLQRRAGEGRNPYSAASRLLHDGSRPSLQRTPVVMGPDLRQDDADIFVMRRIGDRPRFITLDEHDPVDESGLVPACAARPVSGSVVAVLQAAR